MRNISTILSIIALALIGVLFYLHLSGKGKPKDESVSAGKKNHTEFKIAYFDIDSLQSSYTYYKDALEEMKGKESAANAELQDLKVRFQKRYQQLQNEVNSQAGQEAAQKELATLEQSYRKREAQLQENLQTQQMDMTKKMRKQIEDYLATYNKDKGFAYILSYEPGFIMYYKDSLYDVTGDLVKGLNDQYKATKPAK
ncbi:OmpH family outer membrane protein [Paraflavitalea sp. CAU 1676]|uniref:OmpH family outer membrane protein n=1 Tax=Paraflavitalea sp. CAU 1676 TaxID=3032598 RepID=UPI0023DB4B99|nr:OmpH family outer membrane protein [Paraflavitalea sp. CAU 1676]MDF2189806.1 OmpH family outer membrane protein [Paraflavitalea sp. CAU 1676]